MNSCLISKIRLLRKSSSWQATGQEPRSTGSISNVVNPNAIEFSSAPKMNKNLPNRYTQTSRLLLRQNIDVLATSKVKNGRDVNLQSNINANNNCCICPRNVNCPASTSRMASHVPENCITNQNHDEATEVSANKQNQLARQIAPSSTTTESITLKQHKAANGINNLAHDVNYGFYSMTSSKVAVTQLSKTKVTEPTRKTSKISAHIEGESDNTTDASSDLYSVFISLDHPVQPSIRSSFNSLAGSGSNYSSYTNRSFEWSARPTRV